MQNAYLTIIRQTRGTFLYLNLYACNLIKCIILRMFWITYDVNYLNFFFTQVLNFTDDSTVNHDEDL